jgi:MSHA biogenesis protein MshP
MRNNKANKHQCLGFRTSHSALHTPHSKGVSIIAAIFLIVILAFMGVMLVSVTGTSTSAAVNEMQSLRALALAEGGLEYALQAGVYCAYAAAAVPLGTGSFTISSLLNQSVLTGNIAVGDTTVPVASTAGFIVPAAIVIDGEYFFCNATAGNQFTGCIRPWAGSTPAAHTAGAAVTQCVVTSRGTVPTGFLAGNVSRTVRATVGE